MGGAQLQEITLPNARRRFGINLSMLLHEGDLPILNSDRHQVAIVAPVQKFMARWFLRVALEEREQVHTVEMNLEILAGERVALQHLRDHVGLASCRCEGRDEILMRTDIIDDFSIRLVSSGPVFWIVCLPTRPKAGSTVGSSRSLALHLSTPRGPNLARKRGSFG
jgi:hypothetical protein